MAEMKCYTCIHFERAKTRGKIKTSKACDDCWTPDWSKLSAELKEFYSLLSKLTPMSFSIFQEFWETGKIVRTAGLVQKGVEWDDLPKVKSAQKELKEIVKLDIEPNEFPYITFFAEQIEKVNKVKNVKVFIGDKFEYLISGQKTKLEVEHLTPENVVASHVQNLSKKQAKEGKKPKVTRVTLLYTTLMNPQVVSKPFERLPR